MNCALGDRVKDRITGIKGIVTGASEFLYGCRRICIQPEESKDGKPADPIWIDDAQGEVVRRSAIKGYQPDTPPAGPRPDVTNRPDAKR